MVVLTSTREASDYGGRIAPVRPPGSCPRISCPAPHCAASGRGPGMNRRLLAVLITGAIAAAGSLAWSGWPPHSNYLPILICYEVIGLSFLVAGIAAWVRWPQPARPAVHHRRLPVPAAVHPGQPGESGRVHDREPDPGYLHCRRGPSSSGLAHRAAPLEVRVRRGHRRIRADRRLQPGRDCVLESRLQRLRRQLPGQRAARRRRFPAGRERD